jgi:hypothetical protein
MSGAGNSIYKRMLVVDVLGKNFKNQIIENTMAKAR